MLGSACKAGVRDENSADGGVRDDMSAEAALSLRSFSCCGVRAAVDSYVATFSASLAK